jgi:hypothetical protein
VAALLRRPDQRHHRQQVTVPRPGTKKNPHRQLPGAGRGLPSELGRRRDSTFTALRASSVTVLAVLDVGDAGEAAGQPRAHLLPPWNLRPHGCGPRGSSRTGSSVKKLMTASTSWALKASTRRWRVSTVTLPVPVILNAFLAASSCRLWLGLQQRRGYVISTLRPSLALGDRHNDQGGRPLMWRKLLSTGPCEPVDRNPY